MIYNIEDYMYLIRVFVGSKMFEFSFPRIPYILKEKHCNKSIHTIIDTWQLHNDLIINILTRSHYIHKCVHTMYFVFFNIKLT